ncbi:MAG: hypothetical protein IJT94_00480 [Oscillibacter sp.]|nr:hypothetical protein [Oscillibacter sp.]
MKQTPEERSRRAAPSPLRRRYLARLAGRILIFFACLLLAWRDRAAFQILQGWNFFRRLSPLHLLWAVWMTDMALQLFPLPARTALGSQKLFRFRYRGADRPPSGLAAYSRTSGRRALGVLLLWTALLAAVWSLRAAHILDDGGLFLVSAAFYVCDLICVLVWCPFRLLLGNRCCTTCRIFNWDHLMMFTPMLPIRGFFSGSLLAVSVLVWAAWELSVMRYPERFWEGTNTALRCANCTDKLCTQYCGRRREPK